MSGCVTGPEVCAPATAHKVSAATAQALQVDVQSFIKFKATPFVDAVAKLACCWNMTNSPSRERTLPA